MVIVLKITMYFDIRKDEAAGDLRASLEELKHDLKYDFIVPNEEFTLLLRQVEITSNLLLLLVKLLNHPLRKKRSQNDDRKWDKVVLEDCGIRQRPHTCTICCIKRYCSAGDVSVLFSTLISRTGTLILQRSSAIVSCLSKWIGLRCLVWR